VIVLPLRLAAFALLTQTRTATVLSIGDGDTLRVREGSRILNVRLACMMRPKAVRQPMAPEPECSCRL